MIFFYILNYLDDTFTALIIAFSSSNQLAKKSTGKWSTRGAHQGVFDQSEGKFKIAMTWQSGGGLPRAVSQHALNRRYVPTGRGRHQLLLDTTPTKMRRRNSSADKLRQLGL